MKRVDATGHRAPPWLRVHLSVSMLFLSIFIAVPVAPIMADEASSGLLGPGLVTAGFSLATVGTQLAIPSRRRRWTDRDFGVAIACAGLSNLTFIVAPASLPMMAIGSALRGVSFGVASVLASLVILELGSAANRGRLLASYGLATTIPGIFGSSIGLSAAQVSPGLAMALALGAGLLGGGLARGAPSVPESRFSSRRVTEAAPIATSVPVIVHLTATIGYGVFVTFGPIAFTLRSMWPALLFFVLGVTRSAGRWTSARIVDGIGSVASIRLSMLVVALGSWGLLAGSVATVAFGAALYGLGLGVLHNATLLRLLEKTDDAERGLVSTAWNVSIDGGVALGALGVGALMSGVAAPTTLTLIPLLGVLGLVVSTRESQSRSE